ncbi:MAG: hypothetical protein VX527_08740 [Planctomycetota bacterium]|nr:hypothetical protein [Planctomycetota bacterium]
MHHRLVICVAISLFIMAGSAVGQWSDDPSANQLVAGGGSSPAVTKIAADNNGGCWVSWYDASNGYDVLLQHIDSSGVVQFDEPILVGAQSVSWVQDFELIVDSLGRPVLAWIGATKVQVACVETNGTIAWEKELGSSGAFLGQAQLAALGGGATILAWAEDDSSVVQRLTVTGASDGLPITINIGGTLVPSDVKASGGGSFIVSFVHYVSFSGPKRLKAQKFGLDMNPQWGVSPIDVFISGSLQFGNYPEFVADVSGGAVLCWYETSPLMARMQWINADGTRLFGTSGMTVTTESSMVHVNPVACIDPQTGHASVFWVRQNSTQGSSGIQANRIDPNGQRLWGPTGSQLAPVSNLTTCLDLHAVHVGGLATGSWISSPSLGAEKVLAAGLDGNGNIAWPGSPRILSDSNSSKTDMVSCAGDSMLMTCWVDDRLGTDQLYTQNINEDGTLGSSDNCPGDINGDGVVNVNDILIAIANWDDPYMVNDILTIIEAWGLCP